MLNSQNSISQYYDYFGKTRFHYEFGDIPYFENFGCFVGREYKNIEIQRIEPTENGSGIYYLNYNIKNNTGTLSWNYPVKNENVFSVPMYRFRLGIIKEDYRNSINPTPYTKATHSVKKDFLYDLKHITTFLGIQYTYDGYFPERMEELNKLCETVSPYIDCGYMLCNKAASKERVLNILKASVSTSDLTIFVIASHGHQERFITLDSDGTERIYGYEIENVINAGCDLNPNARVFILLATCYAEKLIDVKSIKARTEIWCACGNDERSRDDYVEDDNGDYTTLPLITPFVEMFNTANTYSEMWNILWKNYGVSVYSASGGRAKQTSILRRKNNGFDTSKKILH